MARTAEYRDDIAGAIVTAGTSTAYTVSSYQVFDTLAHMNGQMIAFSPHTTNGATVTLNVDGLGAKPLRTAPSTELLAGVLIQGTPYVATYNNSDGAWYLRQFFGNPYNIPLGGALPFFLSTAPNSSFVFPFGQQLNRTTYSALFALTGTTYGTGDGSTTFNIPDLRGRIIAGKDDMGGSAASRLTSTYFGTSAAALGAVGGNESQTLTLAQLPTGINSAGTASGQVINMPGYIPYSNVTSTSGSSGSGGNLSPANSSSWGATNSLGTAGGSASVTSNNTGGAAHPNVQPTFIGNYIMRII